MNFRSMIAAGLFALAAFGAGQCARAELPEPKATERELEQQIDHHLNATYPGQIRRVVIDDSKVILEGEYAGAATNLFIAEVPMHVDVIERDRVAALEPVQIENGKFKATLDRFRGTNQADRLLSRWTLVRVNGDRMEVLSHGHYADTVKPRADLPEEKPRNKKGLGGFHLNSVVSDLDELDISAVTVNVVLNHFMRSSPGTGRTAFDFGGRTWYAENSAVADMDRTFKEAAKRHIVVSAIILLGQAKGSPDEVWGPLAAHPDADPSGIFVMPNVTTEEGLNAYAAALNFLAERYSRPDGEFGRIHHWILHNEINAGWTWTNAGEKTPLLYMNLYQKSLRIAHLIARQYDPHARAFISLEHHWTSKMDAHCYAGKELLELLLKFSKQEGDFDWAIAFHPYPQDLFEPRVWENNEATFGLNAPKITFKNIEVLDAWAHRPETFYAEQHRRVIHLTEQGLNSRNYSEKALRNQAAGMAYAWNKFAPLESIEVFDYHNWIDNRGEGGLRIGLRKFPDEPGEPLAKKPIWFVYQSLGTSKQEEVTAFAKPVIGIGDWAEVRYTKPIAE